MGKTSVFEEIFLSWDMQKIPVYIKGKKLLSSTQSRVAAKAFDYCKILITLAYLACTLEYFLWTDTRTL